MVSAPVPAQPATALPTPALDPAGLPPPPARGSPAEKAELNELRRLIADRTDQQLSRAAWDQGHDDPSAFAAVLAPTYDLKALPQTESLLEATADAADAAANIAKARFQRLRPYRIDPAIGGCAQSPGSDRTSYPSGSAALGWAMATVLIDLAPETAAAVNLRAEDYAHNRLLCGAHFPSDVAAGKILGIAVGRQFLAAPEFQARLAAARAEIAAARAGAGGR